MTNPLLQVFSARPGTLAIFEAEIRKGTPMHEMEARLLESCEQMRIAQTGQRYNDMGIYPALLTGLRELYRIAEQRPRYGVTKRRE
jgi:hypothetical protein